MSWKPEPWGHDVESRLKIGSMGHGVETGCPSTGPESWLGSPCRECDEAAALAEVDRLAFLHANDHKLADAWLDRAEQAEAKLVAVVKALRHIYDEGHNDECLFCGLKDRTALTALAAARDQPMQEKLPLGHKYARSGLTYADGESHDACAHETQGFSAMRVCGQPESAHQPTQDKGEKADE
jgi:hypothetical protein